MPTILLTSTMSARTNYYGEKAFKGLQRLGTVRINETETPLDTEAIIDLGRGCDIIVSDRQTSGSAAVFDSLAGLAAFVRVAVDVRNIDIGAASRNGVLVTHASAGFMASVSELAIGMMTALCRDMIAPTLAYRAGHTPEIRMGRQLAGSTVGIVGYGAIGRHLAQLANALRMRVLVSDPFVVRVEEGIELVDLPMLLASSDFVVCLAPANEETESMMNAPAFARMRKGSYFLNLSRGSLVDEGALLVALDSGHLAGAALDVGRAPDQMPSLELARHPQVLATPHIGGLTPDFIQHQSLETVRQCAAILRGEMPQGAMNGNSATKFRAFAHRTDQPAGG